MHYFVAGSLGQLHIIQATERDVRIDVSCARACYMMCVCVCVCEWYIHAAMYVYLIDTLIDVSQNLLAQMRVPIMKKF